MKLSSIYRIGALFSLLLPLLFLSAAPLRAQNPAEGDYPTNLIAFGVSHFATEQMTTPEGIDTPKPRFSWKLDAIANGEKQSAYQIKLKDFFTDETLWDSGRTESDQQTFVPYTGDDLAPATEYMVELTVWNADGSLSDTVVSCFSTGLWATDADPNPWKGKWIGQDGSQKDVVTADLTPSFWIAPENAMSIPVGFSVYRKSFDVADASKITKAIANFAGDNSCRVLLNGEEVGSAGSYNLAPAIDLAKKLVTGKNVLAVEVNNLGSEPNPGGAIGAFYYETEEGRTDIVSDASWKASYGTDAAWFAADFDDSAWKNAEQIAPCGEGPWGEVSAVAPEPESIPARYLSKKAVVPPAETKKIRRAVAYLCGLGYYEFFLGGQKIGDHVLDPVLTDYDRRVAYNTYDVTDCFHYIQRVDRWRDREPEANEDVNSPSLDIGVVLGNSRFYSPRQTIPMSTKTYGVPRLLFQLRIEYEDGSEDLIVSDESWKISTNGPIRANNDYDGETCDNRLAASYVPGVENRENVFIENRFGSVSTVKTDADAQVLEAPKGKLVAPMMPPMRVTEELLPISLNEVKPGVWVYDFGQNFVGWCRLAVKGPAGTEVKMRFAETLQTEGDEAGMLYTANLRTAKCTDLFILGESDKTQYYEPRFTYHGFRYAELTGFPGTPDLETLTGCVVGTDLPIVGRFECSDPTITAFAKNIEWGTRGNYLSIPTDCPQRDERHGWQGDRAVGSMGEMFFFNNITLYRKWLQDIEDTQREDGNVSDVAPPYWQLYGTNVTWPSAMTIISDSLYKMYGDTTAIAKHYDSRKKWLAHLATFLKEDGTLDKDNYTDWCVPPEDPILIHSKDPTRQTSKGILATSYYVYNLKLMAKFARMLGKTEDEKEFLDRAAQATDAFNKVFYNAEKGQYDNGTQTSCVLPLAFGMVPQGEEEKVFATLVNNIENVTDKHIGTGLIGAQWLNRILSDRGRIDLSYTFATNRTYPSWGYMLEKGATTVWELWNGDTADPAMNSGNHVMLVGDLGIWYFEYLAGIKADENAPGFKNIIMRPNVVGDLNWVDASYDSIRGVIGSRWELDREKNQFHWLIQIPVNSTASVSVPIGNPDSLSVLNALEETDATPTEKTLEEGRVNFTLGSGLWEIHSEL